MAIVLSTTTSSVFQLELDRRTLVCVKMYLVCETTRKIYFIDVLLF